jgi:hypothetical protein
MGRVVSVTIEPVNRVSTGQADPPADQYRLVVQVDKLRYSAPERQITTASGALAIYSEHIPTTEGLHKAKSGNAHWVPLGRDILLESYLLAKITDTAPAIELTD